MNDAALGSPLRQDVSEPSRLDILPDHHCRQLHNADALDRGLAQRGHIIRHKPRHIRDDGRPAVGPLALTALKDAPRFRLSSTERIGADTLSLWSRA